MDSAPVGRQAGRSQLERRRRKLETVLGDGPAIAACLSDTRFLPPLSQRVQLSFPYHVATREMDLRAILVDIFRTSSLGPRALLGDDYEQALSLLHTVPGYCGRVDGGSDDHRPATHSPFNKAYKRVFGAVAERGTSSDCELHGRFARALKNFARQVLAPLLGVSADDVLYQAVPVLRCSHPSAKATGILHNDYDSNNHQPAELNIWIPMNRAFGANTLYVESAPNASDFSPIELGYGNAVRFWGNQCRHHTVPNTTSVTRVSLDLRAMARHTFNGNFFDSKGRPGERRIGQFYAESVLTPAEEEVEREWSDVRPPDL
ncbi:hypothetical protein T492DRAFT_926467 [Pavlovales sp. CCMP2436]|nr:hypothetical protein T492DRAFT_926467 [Pavlovales sp. CCMP2436]